MMAVQSVNGVGIIIDPSYGGYVNEENLKRIFQVAIENFQQDPNLETKISYEPGKVIVEGYSANNGIRYRDLIRCCETYIKEKVIVEDHTGSHLGLEAVRHRVFHFGYNEGMECIDVKYIQLTKENSIERAMKVLGV